MVSVNSLHVIKVKTVHAVLINHCQRRKNVTVIIPTVISAERKFHLVCVFCHDTIFESLSFFPPFTISSSTAPFCTQEYLFVQKYDRYTDLVEVCVRSSKKKEKRKREKKKRKKYSCRWLVYFKGLIRYIR